MCVSLYHCSVEWVFFLFFFFLIFTICVYVWHLKCLSRPVWFLLLPFVFNFFMWNNFNRHTHTFLSMLVYLITIYIYYICLHLTLYMYAYWSRYCWWSSVSLINNKNVSNLISREIFWKSVWIVSGYLTFGMSSIVVTAIFVSSLNLCDEDGHMYTCSLYLTFFSSCFRQDLCSDSYIIIYSKRLLKIKTRTFWSSVHLCDSTGWQWLSICIINAETLSKRRNKCPAMSE